MSANNEALLSLLVGKTMHNRANFASKGRTKGVALPCEATPSGEATLDSAMDKKKALKAKPNASQPERANIKSP